MPTKGSKVWSVGKRVLRPDGTDTGAIVEVAGRIKVKWDSGRTSYFQFGKTANLLFAAPNKKRPLPPERQ